MTRASYWKHFTYFEQSVISGLIWYIQVSLVHSGHLPDNISLELVKAHHPLMPFIYSEAERLFKIFYRKNISNEIVVRDCAEYPQLNDSRGQIQSYNQHLGQYVVNFHSQNLTGAYAMHLCSQYLEPIHKIKKFGIMSPGTNQADETVSVPNLLFCSNKTIPPPIHVKFHWKLFELMRKRYIRPENTLVIQSTNALCVELTKLDNQAISQSSFMPFKMPFWIFAGSICKSGCGLGFFQLSNEVSDDMLQRVFAEEGTIELNKTKLGTLAPGEILDSSIIDLCVKW